MDKEDVKMWCVCVYIYIMGYYSAIEKKEIMLFTATWMDLEIITLSEVSQISYAITYQFSSVQFSRSVVSDSLRPH